jgi:hypothetical protein
MKKKMTNQMYGCNASVYFLCHSLRSQTRQDGIIYEMGERRKFSLLFDPFGARFILGR